MDPGPAELRRMRAELTGKRPAAQAVAALEQQYFEAFSPQLPCRSDSSEAAPNHDDVEGAVMGLPPGAPARSKEPRPRLRRQPSSETCGGSSSPRALSCNLPIDPPQQLPKYCEPEFTL